MSLVLNLAASGVVVFIIGQPGVRAKTSEIILLFLMGAAAISSFVAVAFKGPRTWTPENGAPRRLRDVIIGTARKRDGA